MQSLPRKAYEAGYNAEMDRSFPRGTVPEAASQIAPSEWDAVSATPS